MAVNDFVIEVLKTKQRQDIEQAVLNIDASWTMDAVTQITARIYDREMAMFKANYFMVRRIVNHQGLPFEIASVEIAQGEGNGAEVTLECRRRQIQLMKRDKKPEAYGGVSATDYAAIVAGKFGLKFTGERTSTKRSISQTSSATNDESVWDVLTRLAGEAQFQVFESNGTLFFASQEWLLGKWGNMTFQYPSPVSSPFQVLEIPNCRRSDDDPREAEIRVLLRRSSTTMALRAGMTVSLSGMGEFDRQYLISEVAYSLNTPDPIGVAMRTPVKKTPKTPVATVQGTLNQ